MSGFSPQNDLFFAGQRLEQVAASLVYRDMADDRRRLSP
jgi:hypothetical protein